MRTIIISIMISWSIDQKYSISSVQQRSYYYLGCYRMRGSWKRGRLSLGSFPHCRHWLSAGAGKGSPWSKQMHYIGPCKVRSGWRSRFSQWADKWLAYCFLIGAAWSTKSSNVGGSCHGCASGYWSAWKRSSHDISEASILKYHCDLHHFLKH